MDAGPPVATAGGREEQNCQQLREQEVRPPIPGAHEEKSGHKEHRGTQANAQPPPIIGLRPHAQAHEPLAQRRAPAAFQNEVVDHRNEPRPRGQSDQRRGSERHADRQRRGCEQPDRDRDDHRVGDPRGEARPGRGRDVIRGSVRPQEVRQLGVRLWPSGGSLREAAQYDRRESTRNVTPEFTRRLRLLGGDLRDQLTKVRRVERRPAGQEVVEGRAGRVDIGANVERLASQLLRRRELRCALEAGRRELMLHVTCQRGDGQSEVTNFDGAVRVHETVRRFDVAVEDPRRLRCVEAADDVEHSGHGSRRRHRPLGRDAIFQRAAGEQLHRDRGRAADFFAAEDVNRVSVADRCRQLPLANESRTVFVAPQRGAQDFQRQASSCLELLGLVDLAHSTAAEQPDDPIRPPDLPVHEAGRARPRWIVRGRPACRGRVVGPRKRFRPGGQQARRAQTFGCIKRQLPSAPRTTSRQVCDRFGHHIPRFV